MRKDLESFGYDFKLARIPGYSNESDYRVMASTTAFVNLNKMDASVMLDPVFGHVAAYYRIDLRNAQEFEPGWLAGNVHATINGYNIERSQLPFTLYVGKPLDAPSMLVRFAENFSPDEDRQDGKPPMERGVWLLMGRRIA